MNEHGLSEYLNNYMLFYITHKIGKRVMQDALVYLIYNSGLSGSSSFQDFEKLWAEQTDILEEKNPEWKISTDESWKMRTIDSLWDDWDLQEDITYLYFYISKYFNQNELIKEIRELKEYRNRVCYAYSPIHNVAFNQEVQRITEIFMKMYKGMESLNVTTQVDKDTQLRMSDIQDQINEVIESLELADFKEKFDRDALNIVLMEGREELKKNYRHYKTTTPCSWMWEKEFRDFSVDRIFTPLKLEDGITLHIKALIQLFAKSGDTSCQPSVIVFSGLAGSGKTSLCRFIVNEWLKTVEKGLMKVNGSKEIDDLDSFSLVIYVELKRLLKKDLCKERPLLFCLRKYMLPKTSEKLNLDEDEYITLLQSLNILFIIDGFDDGANNGEMILRDIIKSFKDSKIILTTSVGYQKETEGIIKKQDCRFLLARLCDFDDKGLKNFSAKVFTALEPDDVLKRKEEHAAFLSMMTTKAQGFDQHLKLPLTVAKLVTLWWFNPKERERLKASKTVTDLFDIMFELWQHKLLEKLANRYANHNFSIGDINEVLSSLCTIAWSLMKKDKVYLDSDHQIDFVQRCKVKLIPAMEVMSAFLNCEHEDLEEGVAESLVFSFIHKTEMEYLAAKHLVSSIVKYEKYVSFYFAGETKCSKYKPFLRYLTGQMAKTSLLEKEIHSLMVVLERADIDHAYLYSLVIESHGHDKLCKVLKACEKNLRWSLTDETVMTSLRFLAATKSQIQSLSLEINRDPYKIKGFLEAMKILAQNAFTINPNHTKLNSKFSAVAAKQYGACRLIGVRLIFKYSISVADSRDTDEFLEALYPWAHLTEYWGHLGTDCGKTLHYCSHLKHLTARVSSEETLRVMSESLRLGIWKNALKTLHIILDIQKQTEISDDAVLHFSGDLYITIPSSKEEDIEWIAATVFMLGKCIGCQRLELKNCEMSLGAIQKLVKEIGVRGSVENKLILHLGEDLEEHEESKLRQLSKKQIMGFDIEFL